MKDYAVNFLAACLLSPMFFVCGIEWGWKGYTLAILLALLWAGHDFATDGENKS